MQLDKIPFELKKLRQWVVAYADKKPLDPRTGKAASVNSEQTWGTFEEAIITGLPYIGFVLTDLDPYTIIDLDNKESDPCTEAEIERYGRIISAFDSYTERSASGRGYHIIIKGRVPKGFHRDHVEVYSTARYMICTGDNINGKAIEERQSVLNTLIAEMELSDEVELENVESSLTDEDLIEMAMSAVNSEKFNSLCRGEWSTLGYPSQSEADYALLSMLSYYSLDNEQVRRLFRMSELGKRAKANNGNAYIDRALKKLRAEQPPLIEYIPSEETTLTVPIPTVAINSVTFPPGLMGELANYIYQSAIRPVPEVALAGAITLMAGVCARSYNISGTGLNQYIILTGRTGIGKQGASDGIGRIMAAVCEKVPSVLQFQGASYFASGPALLRELSTKPCFFSIMGEFSYELKSISDPKTVSSQQMKKQLYLDIYNRSGRNNILTGAVYSDTARNTATIFGPNLTILGESTPSTLFEGLAAKHIIDGLLPRFSVIEYHGKRPELNEHFNQPPNKHLVQKFSDLAVICLSTQKNNTCLTVDIDTEANTLMNMFNRKIDHRLRSVASNSVADELWNRAHVKALKLAALVAVGVDTHRPIIDTVAAQWAIDFVNHEIENMVAHYDAGDFGLGEAKQESEIKTVIESFYRLTTEDFIKYGIQRSFRGTRYVPWAYIRRRLFQKAVFTDGKRSGTQVIREVIREMVVMEILREIPPQQAKLQWGVHTFVYVKGPRFNCG